MARRKKNYEEEGKTNNGFRPFEPKTRKQGEYYNLIKNNQIVIAHGSAGTGKSHVALAAAAEGVYRGEVERIVITKPIVEAQEHLGYLPGELSMKMEPYLAPVRAILNKLFGASFTDSLFKGGKIEAAPLAYMRGSTFDDSFIIFDESQNATPGQLKLLLTRIGHGSKVVINGDTRQIDIRGQSGLEDAIKRLNWIPGVAMIEFDRNDCVRSPIVSDIIAAYED